MFDVFYIGKAPGLFPHEQPAGSWIEARKRSRTRYCWIITYLSDYSSFDFLWQPPPWQCQFVHVWPSQWHDHSGTYLVPCQGPLPLDCADVKYHFHDHVIPNRARPEDFEFLVAHADFDTTWSPHPLDPPYMYLFGNQWWPAEKMPTVRTVTSATEIKYVGQPSATLRERHDNKWHTLELCEWDYSWVPDPGDPPLIYVFGNQWWSAEKMPTVEYHVPGATARKYLSWPRAQLLPDPSNWTVPDGISTQSLDFSWRPDPGSPPFIYQFATQHQKTGGPQYHMPGATEIKYVNEIKVHTVGRATAIYEIDHLDGHAGKIANVTKCIRYFDNYRDTLIRLAKNIEHEHEYVWVCSSLCDYTDFDFTWYPEQWQSTMLHVFASDEQKFGDTFFMHVPTFAQQAQSRALLEWYDVNFVDRSVPRRAMPVIRHDHDTHVQAVKTQDWSGPLAMFTNSALMPGKTVTVPLWRNDTKAIVPLSAGATCVIVPKSAVAQIKTQLYDYHTIDKTHYVFHDEPLDIVFISNGESNADQNWGVLLHRKQGSPNRCVRIDGVNGRTAAYHAAAETSRTPWFFAVFAKLEVNPEFDWAWQPDRMQQPKHYIFHARNPCNRLVYGHQAMIAYNRELVLANPGRGLDFTLDSAHEVVPMLSGVARYNTDAWTAWRTAFRETIKLRASLPDVENEYRLAQWLTSGEGPYGEWSVQGAEDAMAYYDEVGGDFEQLRKSYEWTWLASYALFKRSLVSS